MNIFVYNNKEYNLSADLWGKYCAMHPVRTQDALLSTLKVCYPNSNPTEEQVEQLILQEYNLHTNIDSVIEKAREMYEKSI